MSKVETYQQEIRDAIKDLENRKEYYEKFIQLAQTGQTKHVLLPASTALVKSHILAITALQAQLEPGWIKVSERLPTKADAVGKLEEVLIYTDGKPNPIPYHCITFCPEGYDYWAPLLPEPPKESK